MTCILVYVLINVYGLGGLLLNIDFVHGILASGFVWGIVELLDFIFDLHDTYIKERHYFLLKYKEELYKIKDYIKKHGFWNNDRYEVNFEYPEFCTLIHQLREKLVSFQRDFAIFSMSTEIVNILGYIERLYAFINASSYKKTFERQELSEVEKENILDKIIISESEEQDLFEFDGEKKQFRERIEKEKDIEIDFKEYKDFFTNDFSHVKGNLDNKYFMIPQQKWINVDFKPINDLEKYENSHKALGILCMLGRVLFFKNED